MRGDRRGQGAVEALALAPLATALLVGFGLVAHTLVATAQAESALRAAAAAHAAGEPVAAALRGRALPSPAPRGRIAVVVDGPLGPVRVEGAIPP